MRAFNIDKIQDEFNKVMIFSQDLESVDTDKLFKTWLKSKERFIQKWGGLTKEIPNVSVPMSLQSKIQKKIDFERLCYMVLGEEAYNFMNRQEVGEFFENRVSEDFVTSDGKKINKGAKLSKSIKNFSNNKELIDRIQTALSREIQDNKLTGTLVMSVHPLDFISSSENTHNWRSCHALDGEYRAGNLSYMQDKYTFICYLKSDGENQILPRFPEEVKWNSKKWRVLMFLSEDEKTLMAGKQYPFENNNILNELFKQLIAEVYPNDWSEGWCDEYRANMMMKDALGSLHFNDCLISSSYHPVIKWDKSLGELDSDELEKNLYKSSRMMTIGDALECLCCGQMVSMSESVLCDECGDYLYCDCCGEPVSEDDMYVLNGDYLCPNCYDEIAMYCENCDCCVDTRVEDVCYDEETDMYYCYDCYDDLIASREAREHESIEGEL